MIFESTEGIFIFFLITSFFIISFSHGLIISKETFVQAGHLILFTESIRDKFFKSIQFAFIIISHDNNPASLAGDHTINLSIYTQKSFFCITAQMPSKSQFNVSLNCFVSSILKYSLCLSFNDQTIHFIIQEIRSSCDIFWNE
ncbi:MAG: hypothetical protein ACD_4C00158G0003 [uncultured bacterium (gcode 4)]|uniref:Uncharacterized protein n=1 Tax=uncultured bacterium (gcode 4) TaxID=1234023 RepID=K2GTT2_9BACT|nr:MAG: hypothetical protein ACD_4C00158G0003 [uncultured bacterium (gcode 4)]